MVNCKSCNGAYKALNKAEVSLQVISIAAIGVLALTQNGVISAKVRATIFIIAIVCFAASKWLSHFIQETFRFRDYIHALVWLFSSCLSSWTTHLYSILYIFKSSSSISRSYRQSWIFVFYLLSCIRIDIFRKIQVWIIFFNFKMLGLKIENPNETKYKFNNETVKTKVLILGDIFRLIVKCILTLLKNYKYSKIYHR